MEQKLFTSGWKFQETVTSLRGRGGVRDARDRAACPHAQLGPHAPGQGPALSPSEGHSGVGGGVSSGAQGRPRQPVVTVGVGVRGRRLALLVSVGPTAGGNGRTQRCVRTASPRRTCSPVPVPATLRVSSARDGGRTHRADADTAAT